MKTINVDLIRLIQDVIQEHPEQFDMGSLIMGYSAQEGRTLYGLDTLRNPLYNPDNSCKTVCCIAGWANILSLPPEEEATLTNLRSHRRFCTNLNIHPFFLYQLAYDMPEIWLDWASMGLVTDFAENEDGFNSITSEQAVEVLDHLLAGRLPFRCPDTPRNTLRNVSLEDITLSNFSNARGSEGPELLNASYLDAIFVNWAGATNKVTGLHIPKGMPYP